jgi:DNA topoisomerase-1
MVGQRLQPTELGWITNSLLVDNFAHIINVAFTAKMEKSLDEIEQGREKTLELLTEFYGQFSGDLESAQKNMLNLKLDGIATELACPNCSLPLHIRWGRNGPFLACSGYPGCTFSSDYVRDEKGRVQIREVDPSTGEICDKCGQPMILKRGRFGTFLACSGYPECKNTRAPSTGIPCPREGCSGEMIERVGKSGRRFYGCNKYPECNTTFWGKPVPKPCPLCGSPVLIEKQSKRGAKLACPNSSCKYEEKSTPPDSDAVALN